MLKNKKLISLVVPCRNEDSHIADVIKSIPSFIDEIIIVSNASTDNTVRVVKKISKKDKRVKIVEDNRKLDGVGYGYAHMTGISMAKGEYIAGADGDGTYPVDEFSKVIKYMRQNHIDFVSCNRYPLKDGTKIPIKLKTGVNLLNFETNILYGTKIKDILSGMWIFKKEIREDLNLDMGDWNLSPQIKINAATNDKISFSEYNIKQHNRLGETKQNYFKTGFSHAKWIFKNRFKK